MESYSKHSKRRRVEGTCLSAPYLPLNIVQVTFNRLLDRESQMRFGRLAPHCRCGERVGAPQIAVILVWCNQPRSLGGEVGTLSLVEMQRHVHNAVNGKQYAQFKVQHHRSTVNRQRPLVPSTLDKQLVG
jgi:hypothetical protein